MRLIDADALINRLDVVDYGMKLPKAVVGLTKALLEDAPTIDAASHGRWKLVYNPFEELFICTACEEQIKVPTVMGEPLYEFCPFCGAKMNEVTV